MTDPMTLDLPDQPALPGWRRALAAHPVRLVPTPAGPLACRMAGPETAPAVVLLHGIGSGSGSWVCQLTALGGRLRLLAWDAPGYGDSAVGTLPEAPDADDYAETLAGLLDALALDRAVLVGQSLGAIMAARFAVRHPQRAAGLLLAAPARGHGHLSQADRALRRQQRIDRFVTLGRTDHAVERAPNMLPPDPDPDDLGLAVATMARIGAAGYARAAHLLSVSDILDDMRRLTRPTAVLAGAVDRITPPETCRTIAEVGRAPFEVLDGAAHALYLARPAFDQRLLRFVQGLDRGAA